MHKCYRRKKNNVDKDKLNEPGDGLQINRNERANIDQTFQIFLYLLCSFRY